MSYKNKIMLVCFANDIAGDSKILGQADVCDKGTCSDQLCKSVSMCRSNVVINTCHPVTGEVEAGETKLTPQ